MLGRRLGAEEGGARAGAAAAANGFPAELFSPSMILRASDLAAVAGAAGARSHVAFTLELDPLLDDEPKDARLDELRRSSSAFRLELDFLEDVLAIRWRALELDLEDERRREELEEMRCIPSRREEEERTRLFMVASWFVVACFVPSSISCAIECQSAE